MNTKILNAIKDDYKLSDDYVDAYFNTISKGQTDAKVSANFASRLNRAQLNKLSDEIFAQTLSSKNIAKQVEREDNQAVKANSAHAYNRAKTNKESKRMIKEALTQEELDQLSF